MSKTLRWFAITCGLIAFAFCLAGGLWTLVHYGFQTKADAWATGMGLYFIGKAVFVGSMLVVSALRG
jgi:hypothetical protein